MLVHPALLPVPSQVSLHRWESLVVVFPSCSSRDFFSAYIIVMVLWLLTTCCARTSGGSVTQDEEELLCNDPAKLFVTIPVLKCS